MSATPNQPQHEAQFFTSIRGWGITRGENGVIGGVVEGVGDRIGLARVPARLLALLLIPMTGGLFIAAYAVAWAILPDSSGRIIIQDFGRGTTNVPALIGICLFALIGLSAPGWGEPFNRGWLGTMIVAIVGLCIVAGIIALIAWNVTKDENGQSRLIVEFRGADAAKTKAQEKAQEAGTAARESARAIRDQAKDTGKKIAEEGRATARRAKAAAAEIRDAVSVKAVAEPGAHAPKPFTPPTPPMPPAPPLPLRPRIPGPGKAIRLLSLGAAFLIGAAIWWLDRGDILSVNPIEAWLAAMIVVVGVAIIMAGATGRRIGAFGFWATVLIIGWSIRIVVGPDFDKWVDSHEIFLADPPRNISVEDGTVDCRSFDEDLANQAITRIVVPDEDGYSVTVTDPNTTIVVPDGASVTLESGYGPLAATVSYTRLSGNHWTEFATCDIEGTSTRYHTWGSRDPMVNVTVNVGHANIVIEER